jgi:hypothetical protein
MKVFVTSAYPTPWSYVPRFKSLACMDRIGMHRVAESPNEADIILFVDARSEHGDWEWRAIRGSELYRRWPEKCMIYDETDQPWCSLPGLYVSMPRSHFRSTVQQACSYVFDYFNAQLFSQSTAEAVEPRWLFSFSGRRSHPVRDRIMQLRHPRGCVLDTTAYDFFGGSGGSPGDLAAARAAYAEKIKSSKFVLCPRGSGTASFRLFETLAAGRVPVIVSDEWVPVEGPDWSLCSIRLAEADAAHIGAVLEAAEPRWSMMADASKEVWRKHFAPDVLWHDLIDRCSTIAKGGLMAAARCRWTDSRYWRLWLRHQRGRWRKVRATQVG